MWNKLNLVTQKKGDQLECSHCGKKIWCKNLSRPYACVKCGCKATEEHPIASAIKTEMKHGCWSAAKQPDCTKCKKPMIPTPREGTPNSTYWRYERDDGMFLFNCETCPE